MRDTSLAEKKALGSGSLTSVPFVDGIVVVNLDSRPERLDRFQLQASAIGHLADWERMPAVLGIDLPGYGRPPWFKGRRRDKSWAGRGGCVLSHRKAIEHALAQGWKRVLILEDDVEFGADLANFLGAHCGEFSALVSEWDVCYLGYTQVIGPFRRIHRFDDSVNLYAVHGCYTTHAYILQSATYQWLLDRLPAHAQIWPWLSRHRAIDRWYSRHLSAKFRVAAVSPTLIGQYSDFSDIGQREPGAERESHFYNCLDESRGVSGDTSYQVLKLLRRVQFGLYGVSDALRGIVKRLRGF